MQTSPAADAPAEPEGPSERTISGRWTLAAGLVTWLAGILAPAIAFDTNVALDSALGPAYTAFFQILTTVLFLLAWRALARPPLWLLAALAAGAIGLFVGYTVLREFWTCPYYEEGSLVRGASMLDEARQHLRNVELLDASCETQMSEFQGDTFKLWPGFEIVVRFLALFSMYALSWLALAVLVVGTVRRASGSPAR